MNPIQEIIQQAQRDLYCPTCGRTFSLNEIKLRGLYDHTILLQTACANQHTPVIMIFVASYKNINNIHVLDTDDILKAHKAFKIFDGDFQAIWGNGRNSKWKI
ncbi:MAG: hypothetical protein Q7S37_05350 [bacterium]|nr:hypothetical protein [bacterium]